MSHQQYYRVWLSWEGCWPALVEIGNTVVVSVLMSVVMLVGLINLNNQQSGSRCPQSDQCCMSPCGMHVAC